MADTHRMTSLDTLLWPDRIAVVGASNSPQRIGGRIYRQLRSSFHGDVVAVNPRSDVVQGDPAFRSLKALPEVPDLAFLAVPAGQTLDTARAAIEFGVRQLVVVTAGFAESGPEGERVQTQLKRMTRAAGARLVGPNCMGLINLRSGLIGTFAPFAPEALRPGPIAVVAQSGAVGARLFRAIQDAGLGASYLLTSGNEADVDLTDLLQLAIAQDDVEVVLVHMEGLRDPARWQLSARQALERGRRVVVLKAGRSERAALAAASHTGALAVDDRIVGAAFRQAGVLRLDDPGELVDVSGGLGVLAAPSGPRVAILSGSGGIGVILTDEAARRGLSVPPSSEELIARLHKRIPPFGSAANPIDYTAQIVNDSELLHDVIRDVASSGEFDALVIGGIPPSQIEPAKAYLPRIAASAHVPILVWADGNVVPDLVSNGVPAFARPFSAFVALRHELNRTRALARLPAAAPELTHDAIQATTPRLLAEHEALPLLRGFGLPVAESWALSSTAEAGAAPDRARGPVALKLSASWLPHKSEAGAVRTGLHDAAAAIAAYQSLDELRGTGPDKSRADAVILAQEMIEDARIEMAVGGFRHPGFGPVAVVGLGGRLIEILDETVTILLPSTEDEMRSAVTSLCEGRLVQHHRGLQPNEVEAVVRVVGIVGRLLLENPTVTECDVNPLIVREGGEVVAVDALVRVAEA